MSGPERAAFAFGLLLGSGVGAVAAWYVSRALERYRRARRDFRAARSGLSTLVEMMWRRGMAAAGWSVAGVLGLGLLVVIVVNMGGAHR